MLRRGAGWLALGAVSLCLSSVAPAQALPAPAVVQPASLAEQLDTIAALPTGRVGIAAIDLATGREVGIHGSENFPMASVVKIAVAAAYLSEVDAGRRSLAKSINLDESIRSGSDGIGRLMPHPGVTLSAANLIELMLTVSDNTATDMLIADLGGTRAVQRWLTRNRVVGVRIDREIARLVLDNLGLPMLPGRTAAQTLWASDPLTVEARTVAIASFDADPRDSASPLAIARFLARLDNGQLLKAASRTFLLDVMARCRTGADRIPAGLPEGTPVAHKTGTLAGISNDVGIVTLPDKRRIAIAVFTRGIAEGPARAKIIADATRTVVAQFSTR
ncbi:MAG: class A beta-lactamase [Sphingomonas bacterium]|nr:class A beta-lactamase [Sphingomonas bacterium]